MSVTASSSRQARHRALGLTDSEYERILERLGREPNEVELAMLSLMWSEHCAYKHSRKLLRRLPVSGPQVLLGPGENAGAVDVGDGLAVAFKVESHNHPSAVEPFQGAATGVGGILRDVFAVGARPIALLDSLRFGDVAASERSRYLLEGAVAGIGHYGNSIGVPTVGGEIYFETSYEQNCLINAMCLGIARHDRLIRSAAAGPGNVLVLLGALTGRDGIGGASVLASAELGDGDEAKRPSVQIGDPFAEKKLLECCLELLERDRLVSLQDLGAAGLTSSSAEMASKGGVGIDIDVSRVPLREPGMEPFEIMISESQERMLCVVEPERVGDVIGVCEHWETLATPIGQITDSGRVRVLDGGSLVGDLPVSVLVDDCPLYDLEPEEPRGASGGEPEEPRGASGGGAFGSSSSSASSSSSVSPSPASSLSLADDAPDPGASGPGRKTGIYGRFLGQDAGGTLLKLLRSPNIASRLPVFEQYDPVVQSRTVRRPDEADAAVLVLPDGSAIAVSIDGNGRRVACDPRTGATEAVLECAANLACVGAMPLGVTNCLNFGNPEKPHIAWQLVEAVEGIAKACEALELPIVGGNVSLYNEAPTGPIYPTPVIGMVGKLPDAARAGRLGFAREGDLIGVAGPFSPSFAGSELAKLSGGELSGPLPAKDFAEVRAAHELVRDAVRDGKVRSAHDVAEGGLAVAIAECCIAGGIGAQVELHDLFGEDFGTGFVVSGPSLEGFKVIGQVGGDALEIAEHLQIGVSELRAARERGLADLVGPRC